MRTLREKFYKVLLVALALVLLVSVSFTQRALNRGTGAILAGVAIAVAVR